MVAGRLSFELWPGTATGWLPFFTAAGNGHIAELVSSDGARRCFEIKLHSGRLAAQVSVNGKVLEPKVNLDRGHAPMRVCEYDIAAPPRAMAARRAAIAAQIIILLPS